MGNPPQIPRKRGVVAPISGDARGEIEHERIREDDCEKDVRDQRVDIRAMFSQSQHFICARALRLVRALDDNADSALRTLRLRRRE